MWNPLASLPLQGNGALNGYTNPVAGQTPVTTTTTNPATHGQKVNPFAGRLGNSFGFGQRSLGGMPPELIQAFIGATPEQRQGFFGDFRSDMLDWRGAKPDDRSGMAEWRGNQPNPMGALADYFNVALPAQTQPMAGRGFGLGFGRGWSGF